MLNAFSHLPRKPARVLDLTAIPSPEEPLKQLHLAKDVSEVKKIFKALGTSKHYPEAKISVARTLLKWTDGPCADYVASNRHYILSWIERWDNHVSAALMFERNAPFNIALNIRFRRNYTKSECRRLVKVFFRRLASHLGDQELRGLFVCEPDKKPTKKDKSFHFHGALWHSCPPSALALRECARAAAGETRDYQEQPAIDVRSGGKGREAVYIELIYDAKGWFLYCTKRAEKLGMTLDALMKQFFYVRAGEVEFVDEMP